MNHPLFDSTCQRRKRNYVIYSSYTLSDPVLKIILQCLQSKFLIAQIVGPNSSFMSLGVAFVSIYILNGRFQWPSKTSVEVRKLLLCNEAPCLSYRLTSYSSHMLNASYTVILPLKFSNM